MNNLDRAIENNGRYHSMLALMASLSNLYSDSNIPFLHYRIAENLFCKYFNAINISRTDTAYDAKWNDIGIGIKTFIIQNKHSKEKVAEFNALAPILSNLNGLDLAHKLAEFRNERIEVANNLYGIDSALYHIIARKEKCLYAFNFPYELIDIEKIRIEKSDKKSIHFTDDKNEYIFNRSKSVLMEDFCLPDNAIKINVDIIKDPFELLEGLLKKVRKELYITKENREEVLLPLFSVRSGKKYVPEKSGLNQWNAKGRERNENEVYIPIPASIHRFKPHFFPDKDNPFQLMLPDGSFISAKVCQQGSKALMSNPNKVLGEWILRKILNKKPDSLVTYDDLKIAGFDSVVIYKNSDGSYSLDVCTDRSFEY